jgi:hypothetical protein
LEDEPISQEFFEELVDAFRVLVLAEYIIHDLPLGEFDIGTCPEGR